MAKRDFATETVFIGKGIILDFPKGSSKKRENREKEQGKKGNRKWKRKLRQNYIKRNGEAIATQGWMQIFYQALIN